MAFCPAFWRISPNASVSDRPDSKAAQVELDTYPRDLRQHRRQADITRDGFGPKRRASAGVPNGEIGSSQYHDLQTAKNATPAMLPPARIVRGLRNAQSASGA